MRTIISLLAFLTLTGCAARVFQVPLVAPQTESSLFRVEVKDQRLDPQVYMTGISMGSQVNIYLLAPEPPLDIALKRMLENKLNSGGATISEVVVQVQRLDIKNKVGFGRADELFCEIESKLIKADGKTETYVRTFSKNTENMSPLITTAGKVILQQCLEQHANDLYQKIAN